VKRILYAAILLLWFAPLSPVSSSTKICSPGYGPVPFVGGVRFRYYFPRAKTVAIAGDFNNWRPTLLLTALKSKGAFEGILPADFLLKKTKYRYKLIINGIWQPDPTNKNKEYDTAGDMLSYFTIPSAMIIYAKDNPEKTESGLFRFFYKNPDARSVRIVGSFNNFDPYATRMHKDKNGIWIAEIQVLPGRHLYNFVVDGRWIIDPIHIPVAANRFGRRFSVFTAR